MKPIIKKQKLAYFAPQGFLDGESAMGLITMQEIQSLKHSRVEMVLISLKKVIFFNKNGLTIVLDTMKNIQKDLKATIGFCDYDLKQYKAFFKFFNDDLPFSLFESIDIAMLFAGIHSASEKEEHVLIYNEDSTQRSMQAIELYDRGFDPIVVQNLETLAARSEEKEKYVAIIERSYLGVMSHRIAAKTRGYCVIYYLKGFLDGSVAEQFDVIYHQNCLKVGFQLFMVDATRVSGINIHAANFFSKLSTAGAEYGALIAIVGLDREKTPKPFINELEDAGILFFDSEADFFNDEIVQSINSSGAGTKKKKHKLNKILINILPTLITSTMDTLQMMTNMVATKNGMQIQSFEAEEEMLMASSIAFYGDVEGMMTLAMPQAMVKKACTLLIGEESEDEEVLMDALSELVNIIAGKSKTKLQEEGKKINITLPRGYTNLDDLKATLEGVQGVQVNFSFEDYPFIFYLSA